MPPRPGSGASTRSRRDEVWEMKRQRWLAKQSVGSSESGQRGRPPQLRDPGGSQAALPPAPKSPLSRLVAEGYPTADSQVTSQQPYGDKPASRGSGTPSGGMRHGGFDAAVAGQWSANVQHEVRSRQNRHDPNVSGPARPMGGQRVTQPTGGNANIDLSWGMQPPQVCAAGPPPRIPGAGTGQGYAVDTRGDPRFARHPSPSHAARGGGCPWGRDDTTAVRTSATPGLQMAAPPFGVDVAGAGTGGGCGSGLRAGSRGSRCASPAAPCGGFGACGGELPAAGGRGRSGLRPPGGASSVVFG